MSLFNFVLSGLVFLSLMVIAVIFSRRIKRVKHQESQFKNIAGKRTQNSKKKFSGLLLGYFLMILKAPFKLFDKVVDSLKDKFSEYRDEVMNIEKTAVDDSVVEEEYSQDSQEVEEKPSVPVFSKKRIRIVQKTEAVDLTQESAFESEEDDLSEEEFVDKAPERREKEEKKKINWKDVFLKLKNKIKKSDFEHLEKKEELFYSDNPDLTEEEAFSDGMAVVDRGGHQKTKQDYLIKEVVRVDREAGRIIEEGEEENDFDDKIGVDRKILEKKLLSKVAKDPRNPENYRQLGELYIKMKNYEDAQNSYEFILKLTPEDDIARRRLQKIKLLKRLG